MNRAVKYEVMGSILGSNQKKSGNQYVDKHKQMRICRQNDKLDQLVKHTALKEVVLGSILGSNQQKNFSTFIYLCYTDKAFQSVSLVINSQFEADTH